LFSGLVAGDELVVPEFCLLECVNVLWKHVRFQGVSEVEAETLVAELEALNVIIAPISGLLSRALAIGLKHKLALYDSIYIALAEQLNYPLVTDDAKQATAARAEGITLKPLTDFDPA
jgi:predicted nucleic acid-binding protein